MPEMKPEFPEPEYFSRSEYLRVLSARDVAEALLAEARELLVLRDEQIAILKEKAGRAAELQSRLDNMQYEVEYLQDIIETETKKNTDAGLHRQELMEELKQDSSKLQQLGSLQQQYESAVKQLKLYQQEADSLAAINAELLEDLRKIPMLQSSLEMEKQQNRVLQDKIERLEAALRQRQPSGGMQNI